MENRLLIKNRSCYIPSTKYEEKSHNIRIFYKYASWTAVATEKKQIKSFEMSCYRRMQKVKYTDKVTKCF